MFHDVLKAKSKGKGPKPGPITLSTRVRLARNLREFPFPGRADAKHKKAVLSKCLHALGELPQLSSCTAVEMDELSELDRQILVERHLISLELSQSDDSGGVVLSQDEFCSVMVNEEDHLRIQVLGNGLNFKEVWKMADALDSGIESKLDYAFDSQLGFLTACPTNLGTGMRASVMMHLPGLVMSKNMDKVINAVNHLGIAVRGLFGEGSDASGSIFQISNQQTLGESEDAIIDRLQTTLDNVVRQERLAREKLMEDDGVRLIDKISRAIGSLKTCYLIQSSEAMDHLSLIRLATDFGYLPEKYRALSDRMFIEVQPGHVQLSVGKPIEPEERDRRRAESLRKIFQRLPLLNLDAQVD